MTATYHLVRCDRIAQMVIKRHLEPILEPVFHRDSYGYRPGKSAHDALVKGPAALLGACDLIEETLNVDVWMQREYPTIPFERYADDAICRCASEAQALELRQALEQRCAACRLRLDPEKTVRLVRAG